MDGRGGATDQWVMHALNTASTTPLMKHISHYFCHKTGLTQWEQARVYSIKAAATAGFINNSNTLFAHPNKHTSWQAKAIAP